MSLREDILRSISKELANFVVGRKQLDEIPSPLADAIIELVKGVVPMEIKNGSGRYNAYFDGWSGCRDEMLKNIEGE